MKTARCDGLRAELEPVRDELTAWRAGSGKGQKIPEALWQKAAQAAQRYGLNPVSKMLGLDYNCLKRRVGQVGGAGTPRLMPAFVEVKPVAASGDFACQVELEKGNGTRMRICVQSVGGVDWGRIKEAFLGA